MEGLKTEFLCDMVAHLDWKATLDIGAAPHGNRRIINATGGTFDGPKLKGVALPGGGDWYIRRPDGVVELDVRIALRTDDNHLIYCYYRGINDAKPEVGARIIGGEAVDPSQYYFRITPVFETGSDKYGWLNRIVTVGIGTIIPTGIDYKIYTVL